VTLCREFQVLQEEVIEVTVTVEATEATQAPRRYKRYHCPAKGMPGCDQPASLQHAKMVTHISYCKAAQALPEDQRVPVLMGAPAPDAGPDADAGAAGVATVDDQPPAPDARAEADAREQRIRAGAAQVGEWLADVFAAYSARQWELYGFPDWESYVNGRLPELRKVLAVKDERAAAIGWLSEQGMSQRAIAAATGTSQSTVKRTLAGQDQVSQNDSPAEPDGRTVQITVTHEHAPGEVVERMSGPAVAEHLHAVRDSLAAAGHAHAEQDATGQDAAGQDAAGQPQKPPPAAKTKTRKTKGLDNKTYTRAPRAQRQPAAEDPQRKRRDWITARARELLEEV
jgi:Homeodomain-like domain